MTHECNFFNTVHSFLAICKIYAVFDFNNGKLHACISWTIGIDIRYTLCTFVIFSGPCEIEFITGYLVLATHTKPVSLSAKDVEFA